MSLNEPTALCLVSGAVSAGELEYGEVTPDLGVVGGEPLGMLQIDDRRGPIAFVCLELGPGDQIVGPGLRQRAEAVEVCQRLFCEAIALEPYSQTPLDRSLLAPRAFEDFGTRLAGRRLGLTHQVGRLVHHTTGLEEQLARQGEGVLMDRFQTSGVRANVPAMDAPGGGNDQRLTVFLEAGLP